MHICLGRYLFPETNYTQCRESNLNEMIEFTIAHPCRWKVIESCLPIYFTIINKDDNILNTNSNNNNQQQPSKCYYLHSDGTFIEGNNN